MPPLRRFSGLLIVAVLLHGGCKRPSPSVVPASPAGAEVHPEATPETTPLPASPEGTPDHAASPERAAASPVPSEKEETWLIAERGVAHAVLFCPLDAPETTRAAIAQFVNTVEQALEVKIPVTSDPDALASYPASVLQIHVGETPEAARAGYSAADLPPETFRIISGPRQLFVLAAPDGEELSSNRGVASRPTLWALNHILERSLGVRWLWPGRLGTYIPKQERMEYPKGEFTFQPGLELRSLRLMVRSLKPFAVPDAATDGLIRDEAIRWAENHLGGQRARIPFGHSFGHWWTRYSREHPDYFAELPAPYEQPFPKPGYVKLRLANPAVVEQIAQDYQEAGAPQYWNVAPNDGSGFDISPETRAWDIPANQNPNDIFAAKANLTARYVRFWNAIYERLRQINPEVILVSYAYSSYRKPPPPHCPLTAKTILQIVDSYEAYEGWQGWSRYAHGLFLRPNWWHQGADAPYLPLEQTYRFIQFARKERMIGLDMDAVLGYWATQGVNYYVTARVMNHPELSLEAILDEYTSAFGPGKAKIREYLRYWERKTGEYRYSLNATGKSRPPRSKYHDLVNAGKIPASILNGSKYVLPYLYDEAALRPAERLLDEAEAAIGSSDPEALQRVAFLRKGLASLRATREQIALGQQLKKHPTRKKAEEFASKAAALETFRQELSAEHVIWGEATRRYEERYKVLIRPSAFGYHEINLDGF